MFLARLSRFIQLLRFPVALAWLGAAAALTLLVQPLDRTVAQSPISFLPPGTPIFEAYKQMDQAFGASQSGGVAFVVFQDDRGLNAADLDFMRGYVSWLKTRPDVNSVGDFFDQPQTRSSYVSHDGTTSYMPVGLRPQAGTPNSSATVEALRTHAALGRPARLVTHVTGTSAIVADYQTAIQHSVDTTRIITLILVIAILLAVYRSPVSPLVPLGTVGIAYMVGRGLVSLAGQHGLHVSTFTDSFLIAITFGAGTDYCLFLISRFKEELVRGEQAPHALATTLHRVGEAIASSAATVILGGIAMGGAAVALFSTTGPAIAIAVIVSLLAGLTLTPALMSIVGARLYWPSGLKTDAPGRFWSWVGGVVTRRPAPVIALSLAGILALVALLPGLSLSYDQLSPQPQSGDSLVALRTMAGHFPRGELFPVFILVRSDHSLENTSDMLAVDQATSAAARVPGVVAARSFTQPDAHPIEAAGLTSQLQRVAAALAGAQSGVAGAAGAAGRLAAGSAQLAAGASAASGGAARLDRGLSQERTGVAGAAQAARALASGSAAMRSGLSQLAVGADSEASGLQSLKSALVQARNALITDPDAAVPGSGAYQALQILNAILLPNPQQPAQPAPMDQLIQGEQQISAGAHSLGSGGASLQSGLEQLSAGLQRAASGLTALQSGSASLDSGLSSLSGGLSQVASQTAGAPAQTHLLASGIAEAGSYLSTLAAQMSAAGFSVFYIPPGDWGDPALDTARAIFLSPDAHATRIMLLLNDDPYGQAAVDHSQRAFAAVQSVMAHSSLRGSQLYLAGDPIQTRDLAALSQDDYHRVLAAVLLGVFLILALLLRSLVAPVYLLASVLLSYAASLGVAVGVFQHLLREQIDWTVPIFSFVMLVAVGADYNIFLMARLREETSRDPVNGISRAVRRTGRIITSAGVIFAGTFVAMMISPVVTLEQTGFTIALGLVLDTIVVRSFLVPAVAVSLGRWNWWPRRPGPAAMLQTSPAHLRLSRSSVAPAAPIQD